MGQNDLDRDLTKNLLISKMPLRSKYNLQMQSPILSQDFTKVQVIQDTEAANQQLNSGGKYLLEQL